MGRCSHPATLTHIRTENVNLFAQLRSCSPLYRDTFRAYPKTQTPDKLPPLVSNGGMKKVGAYVWLKVALTRLAMQSRAAGLPFRRHPKDLPPMLRRRLGPLSIDPGGQSIMSVRSLYVVIAPLAITIVVLVLSNGGRAESSRQSIRLGPPAQSHARSEKLRNFDAQILADANEFLEVGRDTFRFDTFGDEAFWGDSLQLHQAIKGASLGGVGSGISPSTALSLGLKVDVDALPQPLINKLKQGKVDLNNPATTVALLQLDAVVGLKGFFQGDTLSSIGITCAICHSTVDNSLTFGVGHRLDGWANRDLDVGKIVAAAPNLSPFTNLLGVSDATVRAVLNSWGPGKFDAELSLDGKAFNPQQVTDGVVTGTNVPGATLIPNAFGLAGFNQHTWTGAWGT